MNHNIVLLLTACINPNGMSFTKLKDPEIRRSQYEQALNFYLEETELKIVFVENTNTYIGDKYQKYIDEGRVEFITFRGNEYPRELGKGYGEALIIKQAYEKSQFIKETDYIVKITGRLIFKKVNALVKESVKRNSKTVATIYLRRKHLCVSNFIVAHKSFFINYFFDNISSINDTKGVFFEHLLYHAIRQWTVDGNKYHAFYLLADAQGISGTLGEPYHHPDLSDYIKNFLKGIYINIFRQGRCIG